MKKFVVAATAAVVATLALASTADAGWRHHRHGWHHHNRHFGVVIRAPRVYYADCFTKKVRRYDAWGNLYIKRVRVCG